MAFIDAATKGLNDVLKTVATNVSEFASDLGLDFDSIPEIELPIPNVLHDYATYDYIITISALHDNDVNFPDNSYLKGVTLQPGKRKGKPLQIICKSANADPNNRVHTDYGKFDFFVDELTVEGIIGYLQGNNISSTNIAFTVKEPYSMGLFTMACQQAAWEADHHNWNAAPFLLTIEFRGNDELGTMQPIPNSTRYIPFTFTQIEMAVNETGSTYQIKGLVWNSQGLSAEHSHLKTDMTVKGTTVQEVLQTGDKSLQSVWNARLQQFKKDGIIAVPDEILIIFPTSIASNKKDDSGDSGSATSGSKEDLYKKLGVTEVSVKGKDSSVPDVKYHVQKADECNNIGKSKLGFGPDRAADAPYGTEDTVYDEKLKVNVRGKTEPNPAESDFKFRQDSSIPNAIDQVILQSEYPASSLEEDNTSPSGYKKWWKIDIQVYNVSTHENDTSTGVKPKIIVYRVVPYNVHASSGLTVINQKPQGYDKLLLGAVKEYNYLYTGKNIDVLSFDIGIKNTYTQLLAADYSKSSQDVKTSDKTSSESGGVVNDIISFFGKTPEKGSTPQRNSYTATISITDGFGGGGSDSPKTRAAKLFHDALISGNDMVNLDMRIVGDPAFLHHSGFGNYTSKPTQYPNLNLDGTINHQSGEVHIVVNFRTPIEIDQTTGMYQFNGEVASTPLMQFSGLYTPTNVTSSFRMGMFEQTLKCRRASLQESTQEDSKNKPFSLGNIVKDVKEFFS
jgi:hypothetical protein